MTTFAFAIFTVGFAVTFYALGWRARGRHEQELDGMRKALQWGDVVSKDLHAPKRGCPPTDRRGRG